MQNAIASENFHQKRLHEEYGKRWDRIERCKSDPVLQALVIEHCKHDILYWVNNWCWTFDPRQKPAMIPFLLFGKQEEYLRWRVERRSRGENGLTEKSRDMGVTWLNVLHQTHCWLFEENFKGAFGSRKEDLVDRLGDPDSIFEKIRILLRHLPKWMLPTGFNWSQHDSFLRLVNPANGSAITGEAGDNIGRGGRSSLYDWDEVAFTPRPHKVDAALSNNTDCVFYTSSANGRNFFWKKRMTYPHDWVFRVFWQDDPRKGPEWYAQMCAKYDPVTIASEIDIDYGASEEGIYIPAAWVMAAVNLELPASGDRLASLDVATTGTNYNVLGIRQGPVVLHIEEWQGLDTTQTAFKAREKAIALEARHLAFDADGVGAGVAGTLASIDIELDPIQRWFIFGFTPLHGGSSPSDREWEGEERTSKEKFANARAEWWGLLHDRFKKTYDHINGLRQHPLDELISIPNHPALIAQLSQPKRKFNAKGKLLIESKEDMQSRGLTSPDHADMLAYLFAIDERPHPVRASSAIPKNPRPALSVARRLL